MFAVPCRLKVVFYAMFEILYVPSPSDAEASRCSNFSLFLDSRLIWIRIALGLTI